MATHNMAVKEKTENVAEEIEWNVDTEVQLFYAMQGHKPVGVNKHFQMACILEKFRNYVNKDVGSKVIWDHLDTMYDMQALDDTENIPFPNEPRDFTLPEEQDFNLLMEEKKLIPIPDDVMQIENDIKQEIKLEVVKKAKEVKEAAKRESKEAAKKESKELSKEVKENTPKKESKEKETKEPVKEKKEKEFVKEPKKVSGKEVKESRRESKDGKDSKKDTKKEVKESPKEVKKESVENKEVKPAKSRGSVKDKKESKNEEEKEEPLAILVNSIKKERVRELSESKSDDSSPKRGAKRSTRGSIKPDDAGSNKSSSPITTPTPPPSKRRRT